MSRTVREHKEGAPKGLKFSVVVVSTSRFEALKRGEEVRDETGDVIQELMEATGYRLLSRRVVPDDVEAIRAALREEVERGADVVVFAGGTGLARSDVTIEAVKPLLEKEIEGFGELFRWLSYREIGSAAMLTRCTAGVYRGSAVFCIPGSPHAARVAVRELIAPEAPHIVKHARES